MNPFTLGLKKLEFVIDRGQEENARVRGGSGEYGRAGLLNHDKIHRMRLAAADLLKILELFVELSHALLFFLPLGSKGRYFFIV